MQKWLNLSSGIVGVIAAVLCLPAPSLGTDYDVIDSPDMPFHKDWRRASHLNPWAAILTGMSVLLMSFGQFFKD